MQNAPTQTWSFTARAGQADKVYLVVDSPTQPSRWIEMNRVEHDPAAWSADVQITPGRSRLRYFTMDAGTYLNHGSIGLSGEPASGCENLCETEQAVA